ncbi:hypothetical protein J7W19_24850 [Streptomyces mobaraensis NBRC 13819 = DSM 40847]|uniref:DUF1648 domain-containing protein n=1 Tax=Streptomyces mobaraensis (strain ATCC 29032 / DSM 40847 / JCM 4168 / NBRC 13819 / NCIMB 11159 / IPCR 16-22) TaxID=1223523 RepID=M3A1Z8_STRM1|nr:hypothetical protein [Streptomyces mobaraensis]EME99113.1 hypothetical protein H340_18049 [Streptomyces mobaraensis NBRC 13819 = DSM 40847]QTT76178.1 hypothetical protein J7W19_24850 [Streptomyces mobaraensis NBRC 13819 = DSM 40847]
MNLPLRTAGRPWRPVLLALPYLLAATAFLLLFERRRDRLPDRLATHFGGSGRADGFTVANSFAYQGLALVLSLAVLFAALAFFLELEVLSWRALAATAYAVAALIGSLMIWTVLCNASADAPDDARLGLATLLTTLLSALVAGVLGVLLAGLTAPRPRQAVAAPASVAPRLPLGASEGAAWTRTVVSRPLLGIGVALVAVAAGFGFAGGWTAGLGMAVGAVLVLPLSGARVTVDRHGLTVAPVWAPRPRLRIGLDRVVSADGRAVDAFREFGGWGYRARSGRSGFVLRSGDALTVRLAAGGEFVVTVDDAATAAALLNTLADRARRRAGTGG